MKHFSALLLMMSAAPTLRRLKVALSLAAVVLISHSASAATHSVTMTGFSFAPANLTINAGDTVTWICSQGNHDAVSGSSGVPNGIWNSNGQFGRLMRPPERFSFTFNSAGTFPYYCTPHWAFGMVGTIRVIAVNSPPTVSIISPANGSNLSAPADITIEADAFDSDGALTRVEFFTNGVSIGVISAPPYRVTVNGVGPGSYTLLAVATDSANATGSASVNITVSGQQPAITSAPQSQTVSAGNDVLFSVQAIGSSPLNYQWLFGQIAIAGATDASLLLTNVSSADSGVYTVNVINAFGSASASATLVVTNPPMGTPPGIDPQPESQTVDAGITVTFTVAASGSTPLSWQWFFNGMAIAGEMTSSLVLSNVTHGNAGEYFVTVSNAFGAATSVVATLTVIVPPVCDFALSKSAASFPAGGGTDTVFVNTGTNCAWTLSNTNTWIMITSGDGGIGPGTVTFTVISNATRTARSGVLVIAGQVFSVTQAGALFPAKGDFNHDGHTDLLWQNIDGRVRLWLMNGTERVGALLLRHGRPVAAGWRIVGTHDFNHNGDEDILWQHNGGRLAIWFMSGTALLREDLIAATPGREWRVTGVSDFNHDGHADFLLRHRDGYLLVWYMKGKRFVRQSLLFNGELIPPEWRVVGVGDINADAQPDILWQGADNSIVVWFMNEVAPASGVLLSHLPRLNARIVGLNDFNQDGGLDFIWRHADGHLSVWWMNGTNRVGGAAINGGEVVSKAWNLVAPKN